LPRPKVLAAKPRAPRALPRAADRDDISPIEFRHSLADHGFAFIRPVNGYVDIYHPVPGRYVPPVTDARGRVCYQATLDLLFATRKADEAVKARAAEEARRQAAIADAVAPKALPVARATLQGPQAIAQLADDFVVASTRSEGVVKADLLLLGWTGEQIEAHAPAARLLAYRRQEGIAA